MRTTLSVVAGGNPQTGLFYVGGAQPGDTIAVHIIGLRLTRDTAGSNNDLVQSTQNSSLAVCMRDVHSSIL